MRFLVLGGGITGTLAAEELRKRRPDADVTIISEEQHPCYSRVLLPHYLKGKVPRERVFLKKETWYAEQNIEWITGERAEHLDVRNRFVRLSNGRELPYDAVLLATGGDVRPLHEDRRGMSYFRTLDDADHLLQLLREVPPTGRAVVYGGGFIACEYVNLFAHFGVPCTVAHRGPHFWSRVLDAESGALIAKQLAEGGVEVVPSAAVRGVEGDRHVEALVTDKGRFPCGLLGVGVGIEPDLGWLREAGVEVGAGIRTNEYLETNVPGVYAAGDVAEFFDVTVGRPRMAGNWMSAQMQGRAVAKMITGERAPFRLVSSYATNVLGLEIIFVGDTVREAADQVVAYGSAAEGGVAQLFVRGGRVVGATLVNRNADRAAVTKWIGEGAEAAGVKL